MKQFEFNKENTFCISLESNSLRWLKMKRRFETINLNVSRWNASDHHTLVDNFYNGLNNGQKGCSQSHLLIYKHIIEFNLPYALILEDDACIDINWRTKLNEFTINNHDNEWDLIMLNGSEPIIPSFKWVIQKEQYLTAGYIISNKGASHILNNWRGCYHASDWMTTRLQLNEHSYCYFPWLIIQEGKDSNIGQQVEADHEKVINCLQNINYSLENYVI
jgi:glycosyl transferase family 25